jgi:hypothetical protein
MKRNYPRLGIALGAVITLVACEAQKSANPLSPTVAGPIPGVDISAPKPLEPNTGWQVKPDNQPITLLLENASSTGVRPLNYRFEVASDSGFRQALFTRDGVTPGTGGRTSLRLPDALAAGHTYYWRARAQDGANTGPFSAGVAFTVVQPVVIDAPGLASPANGSTVDTNPPQLVIRNAKRSGPVGGILYTVQVSSNESFSGIVYSENAPEQPNETRVTPSSPLPANARFYWRARATDTNTQGPWSATFTFVTPSNAPEPPSNPEPPGGGGGGGGGGGNGGSCAANNGQAIISCISVKYASYRRAGVSADQRKSNMRFLRDRMIEAGICGGMDLGWNLKRGGPDLSIDFLVHRRNGQSIGVDIARDYDNTGRELTLTWAEDGPGSHYKAYSPRPSCN